METAVAATHSRADHKWVRSCLLYLHGCFFFFQAEDGIRDYKVTGVQTCALPIQAEDGIPRLQGDWSSDVCSSDQKRRTTYRETEKIAVVAGSLHKKPRTRRS